MGEPAFEHPLIAIIPVSAVQVVQERRPTGTKVLIVTGEDDALVPVAKSESLAAAFDPEFVQARTEWGSHLHACA